MIKIEYLSSPAAVSMSDKWFKLTDEKHFWMKWRFEVVKKNIKKIGNIKSPALEIGCGNGVFKKQLENELEITVDGCDLNTKALSMIKESRGRIMVYNINDKNNGLLNNYSTLLLMDVIEHTEDDVSFLKTAVLHAKANAIIIINVPAYQFLYSKYDIEVGHVKRYSKEEVKKLFESAGIEPVLINYWGALLVPVAIMRKIILKFFKKNIVEIGFKPPDILSNILLNFIKTVELSCFPSNKRFGTSIIAFGKIKKFSVGSEA